MNPTVVIGLNVKHEFVKLFENNTLVNVFLDMMQIVMILIRKKLINWTSSTLTGFVLWKTSLGGWTENHTSDKRFLYRLYGESESVSH